MCLVLYPFIGLPNSLADPTESIRQREADERVLDYLNPNVLRVHVCNSILLMGLFYWCGESQFLRPARRVLSHFNF